MRMSTISNSSIRNTDRSISYPAPPSTVRVSGNHYGTLPSIPEDSIFDHSTVVPASAAPHLRDPTIGEAISLSLISTCILQGGVVMSNAIDEETLSNGYLGLSQFMMIGGLGGLVCGIAACVHQVENILDENDRNRTSARPRESQPLLTGEEF